MTVKKIVEQWLWDNGFTGLVNDTCGCCLNGEGGLFVCGEVGESCIAGYKITRESGEYGDLHGNEWIIVRNKPEANNG